MSIICKYIGQILQEARKEHGKKRQTQLDAQAAADVQKSAALEEQVLAPSRETRSRMLAQNAEWRGKM